jgi:4-oxalocrotonate tautomerase
MVERTVSLERGPASCRAGIDETERRKRVPFVNIRITREDVTAEQKRRLIAGVTDLLTDVLGKNPATTVVIIDEVDTDNWGIGGNAVTEIRKRK